MKRIHVQFGIWDREPKGPNLWYEDDEENQPMIEQPKTWQLPENSLQRALRLEPKPQLQPHWKAIKHAGLRKEVPDFTPPPPPDGFFLMDRDPIDFDAPSMGPINRVGAALICGFLFGIGFGLILSAYLRSH